MAVLLSPLAHTGQGRIFCPQQAQPFAVMFFHHWGSLISARLWSNLV